MPVNCSQALACLSAILCVLDLARHRVPRLNKGKGVITALVVAGDDIKVFSAHYIARGLVAILQLYQRQRSAVFQSRTFQYRAFGCKALHTKGGQNIRQEQGFHVELAGLKANVIR